MHLPYAHAMFTGAARCALVHGGLPSNLPILAPIASAVGAGEC